MAILFQEADRVLYEDVLSRRDAFTMSAVTSFESHSVVMRPRGVEGIRGLQILLRALSLTIMPFDETQARLAVDAYARYGKGLGSAARLNLCDCAAYALARSLDAPLLFKGEDFSRTDVARCV